MDANTVLWHVRVFLPKKAEDYYFRNHADVMTSIRTTWIGMPSITIKETPTSITVFSNDLTKRVELEARMITIGRLIQEKPTHF